MKAHTRQIEVTPNGYVIHCDGERHVSYSGKTEIHRWACCCNNKKTVTITPYSPLAAESYGNGKFNGD